MNIFGTTSGVALDKLATDVDEAHGLFKNGIFKRSTNLVGTFVHKVAEVPANVNLGLTEVCEVSFQRDESIPKIPYQVFQSILKFYKDVYQDIKSEVYTLIVWDKVNKDFFIHVPTQQVSGATVKYDNDPHIHSNPDYLVYCDFHSHNTMNAFFSSTDTKDEVAGRYFGVLGKILDAQPQMALKAAFNRQAVILGYHDLFDINTEKLHETSNYYLDYDVLKSNITERVYAAYKAPVKINSFGGYGKPKDLNVGRRKKKPFNNFNKKTSMYNTDYEEVNALDLALEELPYGYQFEDEDLDYSLLNYLDKTYDLTKDTLFEKDPASLTEFLFDFKNLFKSKVQSKTSDQDILNIFQSLSDLILDYNEISPELSQKLIEELKTNLEIPKEEQKLLPLNFN